MNWINYFRYNFDFCIIIITSKLMTLCIILYCTLVHRQGMLEQLDNTLKTYKVKEEKPSRRDSVFSKISSYRQKWVSIRPICNVYIWEFFNAYLLNLYL